MDSILQVPKRRAVSEMRRELGTVTGGDTVRALFSNDRHGPFAITGPVHSSSLGELVLGAVFLAGPLVTVSDKTGDWVSRKPEDDVKKILSGEAVPVGGEVVTPSEIQHGDLVAAEFEQSPYGVFDICGVATDSLPAGTTAVGGWIILGNGIANPRLKEIHRFAGRGEHGIAVPSNRPPLSTNIV